MTSAWSQLLSLTFALFLLMDSLGNIPLFLAFLKGVPQKRQRFIIFRELLIALGIIILFYFLGDILLKFLKIDKPALLISGGIILFLIAIRMVFPDNKHQEKLSLGKEPFIVPLAIPLVAGPAVLAAVMLYSHEIVPAPIILGSIFSAWALSLCVLLAAPYLAKRLGESGLTACERLMGLLLVLISVQMFLEGVGLCGFFPNAHP